MSAKVSCTVLRGGERGNSRTLPDYSPSTLTNAYEIKELHSQLKGFSKDEMQQITILHSGTPLNEVTKYIDLMDDKCQVITGATGMTVGNNSYYVAKNYLITQAGMPVP
ncbi:hypothetical protein NIES2101_14320 [Calothrix sp. HK-06]|nr:hypothetical protein NIES2101_14320 [Calothrix sp. HK-06]